MQRLLWSSCAAAGIVSVGCRVAGADLAAGAAAWLGAALFLFALAGGGERHG